MYSKCQRSVLILLQNGENMQTTEQDKQSHFSKISQKMTDNENIWGEKQSWQKLAFLFF